MPNATTSENALNLAQIVWETADKYLRNVVEEQEYGDYILPFTVLRRLECLLEPTKDKVGPLVRSFGDMPPYLIDIAVKDAYGLSFYNISRLSLADIAATDDNVEQALLSYVDGFSANIADIWTAFKFKDVIKTLADANRLQAVVRHFANLPLGSTNVEDNVMGTIFENIMYRSFEKKGKGAGAYFTPRDAIHLMVDVLLASDSDLLAGDTPLRSVYDPTAGSAGMLLIAQHALTRLNDEIKVTLFGQEMMPAAYALGKSDLLIQGGRPDAIRLGDTLMRDEYEDQTFDYVLSNPPFGGDWSTEQASVKKQAQVPGSRFSHGLPSKSDGQMLFLAHCAHKLNPAGPGGTGGRAAVVSNASPLFNSDNGPTAIRQWLFDEDLIDAIIALPTQMFYGTGIATYIWILDKNKEPHRKGKIQLIDGSGLWEPMRKPLGDKRREMSEDNRDSVTRAYRAFEDADQSISRVMVPEDFMFLDVPVHKQARLATRFSDEAVEQLRDRKDFDEAHVQVLRAVDGTPWNELPDALRAAAKAAGTKVTTGFIDAAMNALAVADDDAPPAVDRKGNPVLVEDWKIVERVPLSEELDEHMATQVLPFAPEAVWDRSKAKAGNEIPFTRIFYVPEEPRPLAEIDADVARIMGELSEMFQAVKAND